MLSVDLQGSCPDNDVLSGERSDMQMMMQYCLPAQTFEMMLLMHHRAPSPSHHHTVLSCKVMDEDSALRHS